MKKLLIVMFMMVGSTVSAQISTENPIEELEDLVVMSFNNYKSFDGVWGYYNPRKYPRVSMAAEETEYKPITLTYKYKRVEKIYNCIKDLENDSINIEKLDDGFILHVDGKSYSITDGCLNFGELLLEINYDYHFTIVPKNHK